MFHILRRAELGVVQGATLARSARPGLVPDLDGARGARGSGLLATLHGVRVISLALGFFPFPGLRLVELRACRGGRIMRVGEARRVLAVNGGALHPVAGCSAATRYRLDAGKAEGALPGAVIPLVENVATSPENVDGLAHDAIAFCSG